MDRIKIADNLEADVIGYIDQEGGITPTSKQGTIPLVDIPFISDEKYQLLVKEQKRKLQFR